MLWGKHRDMFRGTTCPAPRTEAAGPVASLSRAGTVNLMSKNGLVMVHRTDNCRPREMNVYVHGLSEQMALCGMGAMAARKDLMHKRPRTPRMRDAIDRARGFSEGP